MSLGNVLWIVGTALAASNDDPLVAAATDGESVWLTRDAGIRWQRIVDVDVDVDVDGDGDGDVDVDGDGDGDGNAIVDDAADLDDSHPIRAIALFANEVLVARDDGLFARSLDGGTLRPRSYLRLDALAVTDDVLHATTGRTLLRSEDRGATFVEVARLPAGEARTLAVANGTALIATLLDVYGVDLATGEHRALGCGAASVAASDDGSFWRALPWSVQQSIDGGRSWHEVSPVAARAVAVGTSDVWLAAGGRVGRAQDIERAAALGEAKYWAARAREARVRALAWRRPLLAPRLVARAVLVERSPDDPGPEHEGRVELVLQWDLDGGRR